MIFFNFFHCIVEEGRFHRGQRWTRANDDGFQMSCQCNGGMPYGYWRCDPMDQCVLEDEGKKRRVYNRGDTWERLLNGRVAMNCTCYGESTGRWRCDPIQQCIYEGKTYKVGSQFLQEPDEVYRYRRTCECGKDRRVYCQPVTENSSDIDIIDVNTTPLIEIEANQTASLICFSNRNMDRIYRITWYKLNGRQNRELIYQYSPSGLIKEKIGLNYQSRISKSQGELIDISRITSQDAGRYLCEVEDRNEGVKGSSVTVIRVQSISLSVQIVNQTVTSNSIEVEWSMDHGKSYESMVRWRPKPIEVIFGDDKENVADLLENFPEYVWKSQRLSPKYSKYKITGLLPETVYEVEVGGLRIDKETGGLKTTV